MVFRVKKDFPTLNNKCVIWIKLRKIATFAEKRKER